MADRERMQTVLVDTVTMLCRNGVSFSSELRVQGLLGITVDNKDVFLIHLDEKIFDNPSISLSSAAALAQGVSSSSGDGSSKAKKRKLDGDNRNISSTITSASVGSYTPSKSPKAASATAAHSLPLDSGNRVGRQMPAITAGGELSGAAFNVGNIKTEAGSSMETFHVGNVGHPAGAGGDAIFIDSDEAGEQFQEGEGNYGEESDYYNVKTEEGDGEDLAGGDDEGQFEQYYDEAGYDEYGEGEYDDSMTIKQDPSTLDAGWGADGQYAGDDSQSAGWSSAAGAPASLSRPRGRGFASSSFRTQRKMVGQSLDAVGEPCLKARAKPRQQKTSGQSLAPGSAPPFCAAGGGIDTWEASANVTKTFNCKLCGSMFRHFASLWRHQVAAHGRPKKRIWKHKFY